MSIIFHISTGKFKFLLFSFLIPPLHHLRFGALTQTVMHSALAILLSLMGLYLIELLLGFRKAIRDVG